MADKSFGRYLKRTTVHGVKYLVGNHKTFQKYFDRSCLQFISYFMIRRIFWAVMIILSVGCTIQLIASLIDQISKNPIVIYRHDTPIDATKVSVTMNEGNGILNWCGVS